MHFFFPISLPRFLTAAWGMKPLSQRTDETDQAYEDLLVVFMFILLLFTYALVCFSVYLATYDCVVKRCKDAPFLTGDGGNLSNASCFCSPLSEQNLQIYKASYGLLRYIELPVFRPSDY